MTTFINIKNPDGTRETVDEFETTKEARQMLTEYQLAFRGLEVYTSTRCCANWKE